MKLIGVDPSMTATGIVVLSVSEAAGMIHVELLRRWTIRPKGETLLDRLVDLRNRVFRDLNGLAESDGFRGWNVIAENPTDFTLHPGVTSGRAARYKAGAILGAAVGAVLITLDDAVESVFSGSALHVIDSQTWLPTSRAGNLVHRTAKADVAANLKRIHPALKDCNADEIMAAGVALFWYRNRQRLARPDVYAAHASPSTAGRHTTVTLPSPVAHG